MFDIKYCRVNSNKTFRDIHKTIVIKLLQSDELFLGDRGTKTICANYY